MPAQASQTVAIEVNDVALTAAAGENRISVGPGYAVPDHGNLLLGEEALRQARLKPRGVENRFWDRLDSEPLTRPTAAARTRADLACAHLQRLWETLDAPAEDVILAVPGNWSRTRLGLLLGIARECAIPVNGLVDAAVAASSTASSAGPGRRLVLDVWLHHFVLTEVERDGRLARVRTLTLPGCGLLCVEQTWANAVADLFVRTTRFDPYYRADTEQALHDRLPGWLEKLRQATTITLEMACGPHVHRVQLERETLLQAAAVHYRRVEEWVHAALPAGERAVLQICDRAASLPGLADGFARIPDVDLLMLEPGAALAGALRHAGTIRRRKEEVSFVDSLPVTEEETPPPLRCPPPPETGPSPSHIAYRGLAHALGTDPFLIGVAVPDGQTGVNLTGETAGISRRHCAVLRRGDSVWLEDYSTWGTYVNGRRVAGSVRLRPGDVVRVGDPGQELRLIALADADGT